MRILSKKTALFVLSAVLFFVMTLPSALALDAQKAANKFPEDSAKIICIAHRGDWHSFPENSAQAVNAALGYNAVSVDVKLTSDGKPVLMADNTTERMCVDEKGNSAKGNVSSYTLEEIKTLRLREGNGSAGGKATDFRVPELKEIFELTDGKTTLMLNVGRDDFRAVYDYVKSSGKLSATVFRINASAKEIVELTKDIDDVTVTGNYQGNIIFLAVSAVKECFSNGISTIELGSANGNGILYDNFLMKRFTGDKRAMVSMVGGRCGKRTDNETGWDDLISRGYSVIETDFPAELTEYIDRTQAAATELEKIYDLYKSEELSPYTTESEKKFSSALSDSERLLQESSSFSELTDARFALQSSYDALKKGAKKGSALKFNFSAGKITVVVLCAAAFTGGTLYLRSKRKEEK